MWAILVGLLVSPSVGAQEGLRTKSSWSTVAAMDLAQEDGARIEDDVEVLSRIDVETRWNTRYDGRATLGVAAAYALRSGGLDLRGAWEILPQKVTWEKAWGEKVHLRLGQQVARWGKLESVGLVDVMNPRDLRYGPLLDVDDARIPIPMARLELGPPRLRAQLHLVPFHAPSRVEIVGSDWAIFPPGVWEDSLASMAGWTGDPATAAALLPLVQGVYLRMEDAAPAEWWALDASWQAQGRVSNPLAGVEGGLRVAWEAPRADGAVLAALVREDTPVVSLAGPLAGWVVDRTWPASTDLAAFLSSEASLVEVEYPWSPMVGLDAATTLGRFGFRGEAGWFFQRTFTTRALRTTTTPEAGVGVGVEYTGSTTVRFGAEGAWRRLLALEEEVLLRAEEEVLVGAFLELRLLRERLLPEVALQGDLTRDAGVVMTTVDWRPRDLYSVGAGAFFFVGPTATPRTLEALLAHDGGPLGLYNDNDAWLLRTEFFF